MAGNAKRTDKDEEFTNSPGYDQILIQVPTLTFKGRLHNFF